MNYTQHLDQLQVSKKRRSKREHSFLLIFCYSRAHSSCKSIEKLESSMYAKETRYEKPWQMYWHRTKRFLVYHCPLRQSIYQEIDNTWIISQCNSHHQRRGEKGLMPTNASLCLGGPTLVCLTIVDGDWKRNFRGAGTSALKVSFRANGGGDWRGEMMSPQVR